MKLTTIQKKQLIKSLSNFNIICTVCQQNGNGWIMSDCIFEVRGLSLRSYVDGNNFSSSYPFVVLTCKKCGQVLFFSAVQLGLIAKAKK